MYADLSLASRDTMPKLNVRQIGRLNLLTPARVKAAAAEIRTGEIVCLKCDTGRTFGVDM